MERLVLTLVLTPAQLRVLYDALSGRLEDAECLPSEEEPPDLLLAPIVKELDAFYASLGGNDEG